jgi:hypothetical protein
MGFYTIAVATIMYMLTGVSCLQQKDWTHAGLWFSYSAANVFLMAYEIQKLKNP